MKIIVQSFCLKALSYFHHYSMTNKNSWFVYMVLCSDNSLYTGVTTDLKRRIHEHNYTLKGARYTRIRRPVKLVFSSSASSRSDACKQEYRIKQLSPEKKRMLAKNE